MGNFDYQMTEVSAFPIQSAFLPLCDDQECFLPYKYDHKPYVKFDKV
jgi:hypothetical protein